MTRSEALAEARRRWAARADEVRLSAFRPRGLPARLSIRLPSEAGYLETIGSGQTWEAAFADADRRAGGAS